MDEEAERMSEHEMANRVIKSMITLLITRLGPVRGTAVLREVEQQLSQLVDDASKVDWDPRKYSKTLN